MIKAKWISFEKGVKPDESIDVEDIHKQMNEKKNLITWMGVERDKLQAKIDSTKSTLNDFISKKET